ncbi:hypothetical protein [Pseudobacteroides cellulosolvens]|uniref:Uncharacterized protein n=1 Tax=Pseudobacteroides cellulosolvens ATCC 35603 = DSM 2933 TaxID=398512 RepID=A0A0L6JJJ4_9FIRM|nr:hypothetical protein [Pseudobacteroides cellulosolvens]KNY25858.1 hypothetical protein Bccel_1118 [Pseudobacteroides cellulosolvens ATCC 35603 = DSM 2933]
MKNKQIVRFNMYQMEYKGSTAESNLSPIPFEEKYYEQYKNLITKCNKNAIALYKSLGFEVMKETTVEGVSTKDADGNWKFEFTETGGLNLR